MGNMSGSYGSHYTLWQSITQNSQDIGGNKSNVTVRMYLSFDGSSYYAYTGNTTYGSMTIEGTTTSYSISSINFSSGQKKDILLATWTGDIGHNSDGTRTLSVSGSWNTDTTRIGSGSCRASLTLSTIPRASSISCSTANIGSNATITITSASPSFVHNVYGLFGTIDFSAAANIAGGSFQWTIPTSFYTQIPNAKTGEGIIVCETYSGSTKVGTTQVKFYVNTDENACRPTVSATLKDVNATTVALTRDSSKLIKYKSIAQLDITSASKNSASIKSVTVNGANVGTSGKITVSYSDVSTENFTITTTDSRGYTASTTLTPEMIQYIPLTINATFFRPLPTTGEVDLTYSGNYFNGTFGITGGGTGFTVGDTINSSDIACNFPENLYVEIQNLGLITDALKLLETDKYTLYAGVPYEGMTPRYGIYFRDNSTRELYDLYHASYYEPIEGYKISTNVSSASEAFGGDVDLGTITYVSEDTTFMKYIFNGGLVDNNNSLSIIWQYKEKDSEEWIEGGEITPTIEGNTIVKETLNLGNMFNYHLSYDFQIIATDKLTTISQSANVSVGLPVYNWGKDYFNVNGDIRMNNKSILPVSLYDNSSGTTGTVQLSESAANFSYLEMYFKNNDDVVYFSQKVHSPNGKKITVYHTTYNISQGTFYVGSKIYNISGTSMNVDVSNRIAIISGNSTDTRLYDNISCVMVIGYR